MNICPIKFTDFYKTDHRRQYPKGTTLVYSNLTARKSRVPGIESIVFFGLQYFIKEILISRFNRDFFCKDKKAIVANYKRRLDTSLGIGSVPIDHIEKLHEMQYLPLLIKAIPEGAVVPMGIPVCTIVNTEPDFFWLTNFIETMLSATVWGMCNSATIALKYKQILTRYADETIGNRDFVKFQGHDFSFRGMFGIEAALLSGAGHLTSFCGTDTLPAIDFVEEYYNADSGKELIGCSVPATEHSVMCLGQKETEYETFKRIITEVYPSGIVSIVSDTWDFWKVMTETLPLLKEVILQRNGKVVIRPDSGDPVKIICGDPLAEKGSPEYEGAVKVLWNVFGGETNGLGYKQLNSKIGLIYGDSITTGRCEQILKELKVRGFASNNIVFGIGSYTYQYNTRDNFGFAIKSTYGEINGKSYEIFKDPVTDHSGKKSAKGLLKVKKEGCSLSLEQCVSKQEEKEGELEPVFRNGVLLRSHSLKEIRMRIDNTIIKEGA